MTATDLTIRIGAALSKSFSASFGQAEERASGMGKAYAKVSKELGDVRSLRRYRRELDRLQREGRQSGQSEEAFQRQIRDTEKALDRAQRKVRGYGHSLDNLSRLDRRLATRRYLSGVGARISDRLPLLKNAGVAAGGAAMAGVGSGYLLTQRTASSLESAGRFAHRTGMDSHAVQEMDFVAQQYNLDTERMRDALQEQSVRIGEALRGEGQALPALEALSISPESLGRLAPDAQMERLAEALSRVPNQNIRLSLADQLYGDPGQEMLQLFRDGGQGIRDKRALARRVGYVAEERDTRQAMNFNAALSQGQARLAGLSRMVGTALMPEFTRLFDAFSGWFDRNRGELSGMIDEGIERTRALTEAATAFGRGALSVLRPVGRAITGIVDGLGGWENAGKLLAGLMAGRLLGAVLGLNGAIAALLKLGLGRGLGASARGAGHLLRSLVPLVPTLGNLRGMTVATMFNLGLVGDTAKRASGGLKSLGRRASVALKRLGGLAASGAARALSAVAASATGLSGVLAGALTKGIGIARLAIIGLGRALMSNPIGLVVGAIAGAAYLIYTHWRPISQWFSRLWDSVTSVFSAAWRGIIDTLDRIMARARTVIENPWQAIRTIFEWSPAGLVWKAWSGLFALPGRLFDRLGESFTEAFPGLSNTISDQFGGIFRIASGWYDRIADKFSGIGDLWDKAVGWMGSDDDDDDEEGRGGSSGSARRASRAVLESDLEEKTTDARASVTSTFNSRNHVNVTVQMPAGAGTDENRLGQLVGDCVAQAMEERDRRQSETQRSALHDTLE